MNNYRDLNKELVEQVQTMRRNMKLYCDEIIHLKEELFQKHETEVNLRKQCYNWAVNNSVQLIQLVQPDCDILPILKEHMQSHEKISSSYSTGNRAVWRARTFGQRSPDTPRRSSIIAMELQRSNSIVNIRQSVCSTSPIRIRNDASDDEEEQNSQYVEQDTENQAVDNGLAQNEKPPELLQDFDISNTIYEESEEMDEEQSDDDLDVESVYDSIEEVSVITPIRSPLKDIIINTITDTIDTSKVENHQSKDGKKKGRHRKTKMKNDNDNENTADSFEYDNGNDIKQRNTRSRKQHEARLNDSEENLQEPRRHSNAICQSETNKSIPIGQDINKLQREETLNSSTCFISNITGNIKDAACSTPNSRKNSLITTRINRKSQLKLESSVLSEFKNSSTRPSRKCKPKDLTEPKVGTKLRREDTKTKLEKTSRSKKTKI